MALFRFEVGLISVDHSLVGFYSKAFELEELPPLDGSLGTIYRLQAGDSVLKILVPKEAPEISVLSDPFYATTGLRYLTFRVDKLGPFVARAMALGARVRQETREIRPGTFLVILADPAGNMVEVIEDSGRA
jgi:catechol 2,3-dioxygenase-like lactoylglutathione lyase family enzyme